ncbi:DUF2884 family protein [Vibrio salinus]|uniref:DUF2884 family protein n=1 Tax=Vibrio salinus TaxID=2899784 RepID=UPI001E602906|nr:DUF2884 family protein [Vibrio salinus]MCE0494362.1 YggN family protein [Vibrio salinus]
MSRFALFFLILFSPFVFAEQCHFNLKNELHYDGNNVSIVLDNGKIATLSQDDRLIVNDTDYPLTSEQQSMLSHYRQTISSAMKQYESVMSEYMQQPDILIDELSSVLGDSNNFEVLRKKIHSFWHSASSHYYQNGQFVVGDDVISQLDALWDKMKAFFDHETLSDLWAAFSEGTANLGNLTFSEFASLIQELNSKIYRHWQQFSEKKDHQKKQLCDSFNQLIDQEKSIHESIPELENYQVFTI